MELQVSHLFPMMLLMTVVFLSATSGQEIMSFTGPGSGSGSSGMWGKINSRFAPLSRRMDCSVLCRRTGFTGFVGGCQCGFTLFTKKSVTPVRYPSLADSDEDQGSQQSSNQLFKIPYFWPSLDMTNQHHSFQQLLNQPVVGHSKMVPSTITSQQKQPQSNQQQTKESQSSSSVQQMEQFLDWKSSTDFRRQTTWSKISLFFRNCVLVSSFVSAAAAQSLS